MGVDLRELGGTDGNDYYGKSGSPESTVRKYRALLVGIELAFQVGVYREMGPSRSEKLNRLLVDVNWW